MGNSVQDQLLKLGLVKKNQVSKTNKQKHKNKKRQTSDSEIEQTKNQGQKNKKKQKDYARLLNEQQARERKKKEEKNRLHQIVERHQLKDISGEIAYKFTDDGKIKKLYTTKLVIDQLAKGIVAIVQSKEGYGIVPGIIGLKIKEIDQKCLCLLNKKEDTTSEDDPYADFQVPDDLMW